MDITSESLHVRDNRIFDVFANSSNNSHRAYGIVIRGFSGGIVQGNHLINTQASRRPCQLGSGILFEGSSNSAAIGNSISMHPICLGFTGRLIHTVPWPPQAFGVLGYPQLFVRPNNPIDLDSSKIAHRKH
jgi:hypothetical protein